MEVIPGPRAWWRVALAMFVVGWGANQFAPMLLVYRLEDGASDRLVTGLFAVYIAGLIPTLLATSWLSNHLGRRAVVRPVLVASALASLLLALGASQEWGLFAGRMLAGAAAGGVMAAGTPWVAELSAAVHPGSGARRAAVALSAGFGLGPVVSGLCAELLPWDQVLPYLVHVAATLAVTVVAWGAPEPVTDRHRLPGFGEVLRVCAHAWFVRRLLFTAPWVFGSVTLAFVVLPLHLADALGSHRIALTGLIAGLALGSGVLIQPTVRRREQRDPGAALPLGVGLLVVGVALAVLTDRSGNPWLLVPSAVVLGASYGTLLVAGLQTVARHVTPAQLAPVTAVFYSLTYLGFLLPNVIAWLG